MLSEQETSRLEELSAKRKKARLDGPEFKEFKELLAKAKGTGFKAGNDLSWWIKANELVRDSSNFTPNWIPGEELDSQFFKYRPVGVMRVTFEPTYGSAWSATDPINMSFRDLFLKMFQKFRGITTYQHADLGMVIISEFEIVGLIAKLERIYGVVNRYSKANFNMPATEIAALGLTAAQAEYIRNHLSDYRYDLNILIRRAQRMLVPKDYSIIANKLALLGYEYLDHDKSSKAQIIVFDTNTFGKFNETTFSTGSNVEFSTYAITQIINFSDPSTTMFPLLSTLLDALLSSDSVNKILGDLLVWFGEEQMLAIKPLSEDLDVIPVYSESILHKLHNAHTLTNVRLVSAIHPQMSTDDRIVFSNNLDSGKYYVYQAGTDDLTSIIVSKLSGVCTGADDYSYVTTAEGGFVENYEATPYELLQGGVSVLDTYRSTMDTESVVEGVLWKFSHSSAFKPTEEGRAVKVVFDSFAFEAITQIGLYQLNAVGTGVNVGNFIQFNDSKNDANMQYGNIANVDWAPLSYGARELDPFTGVEPFYLTGEYENMRVLTGAEIRKLQWAIVISGFTTNIHVVNK